MIVIHAARRGLQHPEPDHRGRTADLRQITRKVVYKLAGSYFETDLQYLEIARKMHPRAWRSLVAWKPAWFAHVDPAEPFPHFARTRDVFAAAGIEVRFQSFDHPVYAQRYQPFEPFLSVVDLVMNCGGESLSVIRSGSLGATDDRT